MTAAILLLSYGNRKFKPDQHFKSIINTTLKHQFSFYGKPFSNISPVCTDSKEGSLYCEGKYPILVSISTFTGRY